MNAVLSASEKECVIFTHDETTLYANEVRSIIWIKPKSHDASIMISGFACSCHGFMKDDELNLRSHKTFLADSHREVWFINADLIEQLGSIYPLVEKLHPDKSIVFAFDNSMTHHAKAPDGLDASLLTLKDNGKNMRPMRDTTFYLNGELHNQKLVNKKGQPKGLYSILFYSILFCLSAKNGELECFVNALLVQPKYLEEKPDLSISQMKLPASLYLG